MLAKPNEAIIQWFENLTPGQRSDTAFLFLMMLPGFSIPDLTDKDKIEEDFISFLKGEGKERSQLIGRVLCARAFINWIIRNKETDPWDAEKDIEGIIVEAKKEGDSGSADFFREIAMQFPLRKKQWIKAAETWREMCDTVISDDSIEAWGRELFLASHNILI